MADTVSIQLQLPDGRLVMQRRDANAPTSANLLGFFGGHIEPGEDPETAAHRELGEETSLNARLPLEYVGEFDVPAPGGEATSQIFHLFKTTITNDTFRVFEGIREETYTPDELRARTDLTYTARHLLDTFLT